MRPITTAEMFKATAVGMHLSMVSALSQTKGLDFKALMGIHYPDIGHIRFHRSICAKFCWAVHVVTRTGDSIHSKWKDCSSTSENFSADRMSGKYVPEVL